MEEIKPQSAYMIVSKRRGSQKLADLCPSFTNSLRCLSRHGSPTMEESANTTTTLNLSDIMSWENQTSEQSCTFTGLAGLESIRVLVSNLVCYRHGLTMTVVITVLYIVVCMAGLLLNLLVIVILRRPRMKSVTNAFILSLAVADLFVIMFCVPATLLSNIYIPWVLGTTLCKGIAYLQGISVFSSVYSLVALSIERSQAIRQPLGIGRAFSSFSNRLAISLIWITAALIASPTWVTFEIVHHPFPNQLPFCIENWSNPILEKVHFIIVHFVICFTGPLLLIMINNVSIWRTVSSREIPDNPSSARLVSEFHRKTRRRVLKMLTSLTFTFFISWLPLYIGMMHVKLFGFPESPWAQAFLKVAIPFSQLMGAFNSVLNPILYVFLNKRCREMVTSMLSTHKARNRFVTMTGNSPLGNLPKQRWQIATRKIIARYSGNKVHFCSRESKYACSYTGDNGIETSWRFINSPESGFQLYTTRVED